MEYEIFHIDDTIVILRGFGRKGTGASKVGVVQGTPGDGEVVPGIAGWREDTLHPYEGGEKKKEMPVRTLRHFGISLSPPCASESFGEKGQQEVKVLEPLDSIQPRGVIRSGNRSGKREKGEEDRQRGG